MSANRQFWYPYHPKDELSGETMLLTCEEYGVLQRFRNYSWENGGIPNSDLILRRLAVVFGLSRYKLNKLWPVVKNFFTLKDGAWWYEDDEAERRVVIEISRKRRISGLIGAEKRWAGKTAEAAGGDDTPLSDDDFAIGKNGKCYQDAMANDSGSEWQTDGQPQPQPQPQYPPPPPTPSASGDGGGGSQQSMQTAETAVDRPLSEDQFQSFSVRSAELGLSIPSRGLCRDIQRKFPGVPTEEVVKLLPKFPGQNTPGLWASKSREELLMETERQRVELTQRKPTAREQRNAESDTALLNMLRQKRGNS